MGSERDYLREIEKCTKIHRLNQKALVWEDHAHRPNKGKLCVLKSPTMTIAVFGFARETLLDKAAVGLKCLSSSSRTFLNFKNFSVNADPARPTNMTKWFLLNAIHRLVALVLPSAGN